MFAVAEHVYCSSDVTVLLQSCVKCRHKAVDVVDCC